MSSDPSYFQHRPAQASDIPALTQVMDAAIRVLLRASLSEEETAASFAIMGLDSQLIADGTYFVVERGNRIAGCGGWSRRETLFGGDHTGHRSAELLDPAKDAARIRAMYTHPDFARQGVGRVILSLCEDAARRDGFARVELAATMSGRLLYLACGYEEIEAFFADTPAGVRVPLVRMGKLLKEQEELP